MDSCPDLSEFHTKPTDLMLNLPSTKKGMTRCDAITEIAPLFPVLSTERGKQPLSSH